MSDEILGTDVEIFGDLMLDVAEAYMAQQEYQEALNFLEKLVNSENWAKVKQILSSFFVSRPIVIEASLKQIFDEIPTQYSVIKSHFNISL